MKKNNLYKIVSNSALGFVFILCISQSINAQEKVFSNSGDVKVENGTIVSIYMDYTNKGKDINYKEVIRDKNGERNNDATSNRDGNFVNDGLVHIFRNWNNDGTVSFSNDASNGTTFFTGGKNENVASNIVITQKIIGSKISDFQNVIFENKTTKVPFQLDGIFSVGKKADFLKGIIDADSYDGLAIFKENAIHVATSDLSFVNGKVEKDGKKEFLFPVGALAGNAAFYRPSFHAVGANEGNIYTTQYFYKDSNADYDHNSKDNWVGEINKNEYWKVTQDEGADKIILSLTMREGTTPAEFLNPSIDKKVVIVRWDENKKAWINEHGETSNHNFSANEPYSYLVTAEVSGYGIFTLALVDKTPPEPEDDVIVYNALSPNDDGLNDNFLIKGIDKYPDNQVEIYNRWGVKVYEAKSYNESDVMFRGYSDGRATVNRNEKLPTGTYFYILKYNNGIRVKEKAGYLYINNQ